MDAVIREPIHPNTATIRRPSPGLARLLTSTRRAAAGCTARPLFPLPTRPGNGGLLKPSSPRRASAIWMPCSQSLPGCYPAVRPSRAASGRADRGSPPSRSRWTGQPLPCLRPGRPAGSARTIPSRLLLRRWPSARRCRLGWKTNTTRAAGAAASCRNGFQPGRGWVLGWVPCSRSVVSQDPFSQ